MSPLSFLPIFLPKAQKHSRTKCINSLKQTQLGITILELLTVLSIIGIIAYTGVPQFNGVMTERDLNTAKNTLIQTLNKAKNIARAESTTVDVNIEDNIISLAPYNSSPSRTMKMPKSISVNQTTTFSFNAAGIITGNNGLTNIVIQSTADNNIKETITVSTTGMIAAL